MKVLIVTDNLYPELGGSFKAITDTNKILSENSKFKSRIVIKSNGKFKKKLDLFFSFKSFNFIFPFKKKNDYHSDGYI